MILAPKDSANPIYSRRQILQAAGVLALSVTADGFLSSACLLQQAYAQEAANDTPAWSAAYESFVLEGGLFSSDQDYYDETQTEYDDYYDIMFALHDMDADGIPELIAFNGSEIEASSIWYVYAYHDGQVVYLGSLGGRHDSVPTHAQDQAAYPGLFRLEGTMGQFETFYYSISDGVLTQTLVAQTLVEAEQSEPSVTSLTDDPDLFAAQESSIPLAMSDLSYIETIGWDTFVSLQGYGDPLGWSKAFERFVIDELFLSTSQGYMTENLSDQHGKYAFALYDMDSDGTPELVAFNGSENEGSSEWYVYGYKGQRVVYLGSLGWRQETPCYAEDRQRYPGLFRWFELRSNLYQIYYYTLEGYALTEVYATFEVALDDGEAAGVSNIVDDMGLLDALGSDVDPLAYEDVTTPLSKTLLTDIQSMGWDAFVSSQGFDSGNQGAIHEITVSFDDGDNGEQVERTLSWGFDLFDRSANAYSHDLAWAALYLAEGTYHGADGAEARMADLGFTTLTSLYYEDGNAVFAPAVTFGSVKTTIGGQKRYCIAVAVRGTQDSGDKLTDILGEAANGYYDAATRIKGALQSHLTMLADNYYGEQLTADNTVLFIAGHSLGGAVAGYLGRLMIGEPASEQNVFAYTFASPKYRLYSLAEGTASVFAGQWPSGMLYDNVHNVVNKADLVPTANIGVGFGRYGYDWYYDINVEKYGDGIKLFDLTLIDEGWLDWNVGINANHATRTYRTCLESGLPSA